MNNLVEKFPTAKVGRPTGSTNRKNYKWKVVIFDDSTRTFKEGKYTTVNHINEELNLKLNADYVRRIMTKYRADPTMKNKENSFLARWGHIQIEKINEPVK